MIECPNCRKEEMDIIAVNDKKGNSKILWCRYCGCLKHVVKGKKDKIVNYPSLKGEASD